MASSDPASSTPPEPLSPEAADALSEALRAGLSMDLDGGTFPNPEGWKLAGVSRQFLMQKHVPVAKLEREGATLCFIVTPTDPRERVYKRTPRFDLVYFSEDVPDPEQHRIYERDRATIDRFAAWLAKWDARSAGR